MLLPCARTGDSACRIRLVGAHLCWLARPIFLMCGTLFIKVAPSSRESWIIAKTKRDLQFEFECSYFEHWIIGLSGTRILEVGSLPLPRGVRLQSMSWVFKDPTRNKLGQVNFDSARRSKLKKIRFKLKKCKVHPSFENYVFDFILISNTIQNCKELFVSKPFARG